MSLPFTMPAAARRLMVVAAMLAGGAVSAWAQQTKPPADTAKKPAPVVKTVTPPPAPSKTAAPTGTPSKTATPPTTQPKTVAPTGTQSKTATPPTTQPKTVAPTGTQSKTATPPVTQPKAGAPAPAPGKTSTAPATTGKTTTLPQNKPAPQQAAGQAKPPVTAPGAKPPVTTPSGTTGNAPRNGRGATGLNVAVRSDTASAGPLVLMREVFDYNRDGRRDPFLSLLATTDLRPTLSDLTLLMTVVDEPGRSVALVSNAYDRKQKTIRVGTKLGRMRVSSIRADAVVFTIEEFGTNRRDSLLLRDSTKARGR